MIARTAAEDLGAWIDALRGRLVEGEFDGRAPIDLGFGTASQPAAMTVRVMLADLDHHDALRPRQRSNPHTSMRHLLLFDFQRLGLLLG